MGFETIREPNHVDLDFHITEGKQQFVREVLVEGLHITRRKLVDDQIHIKPGDPLSPIAMSETQRRLYDLGVFARVDAAVQNPDGDEESKYVLYEAEEARRYSITGGLGAEIARIGGSTAQADLTDPSGATGFSPRVSLDVSRINAFGIGDTVTFRSRLSTLQKRAALDYQIPRLFGSRDFDIDFSALYDDSRDVRTFGAKRAEFAVQVTQRLTKPITLFYRYAFRNVQREQSQNRSAAGAVVFADRAHRDFLRQHDTGPPGRSRGCAQGHLQLLGTRPRRSCLWLGQRLRADPGPQRHLHSIGPKTYAGAADHVWHDTRVQLFVRCGNGRSHP